MMINNIFALFFIGALGNIFLLKKAERLFSFFLLLVLGGISYAFISGYINADYAKYSFSWLKYLDLEVKVDLSFNKNLYQLFIPVLILSVLSVFLSVFNPKEEKRQQFISQIFLSLFFYLLLLTSQNLFQLIVANSLFSVVIFCLINDIDARKKYAFYNFLSDISLFSICSLFYAYLNTLNINAVELYQKSGAHKDLVAILFLFSLSIKSGLFMFHNQFYDMSVLTFNRLNYVLYCGTPTIGMVLLYKLSGILSISDYAEVVIKILALGTFLSGLFNVFFKDNIKEKAVGMAQLSWGTSFYLILMAPDKIMHIIFAGSFLGYLLNLVLYSIYHISSYEQNISKMGGFIKNLKLSFVLYMLIFFCGANLFWQICSPISLVVCAIYLATLGLVLGYLFHQIFLGEIHADERVFALLKNCSYAVYIVLLILGGISVHYVKPDMHTGLLNAGLFVIFLLSFIVYPFKRFEKLYQNENIQEIDVFEDIFDFIIITPIRILGRILWLLVDFILIERTIINTWNAVFSKFLSLLQKLDVSSLKTSIIYVVLSFAALAICLYVGK